MTIEIGGYLLAAVIIVVFGYLVVRWWEFAGRRKL
jgi:hypothetical protein